MNFRAGVWCLSRDSDCFTVNRECQLHIFCNRPDRSGILLVGHNQLPFHFSNSLSFMLDSNSKNLRTMFFLLLISTFSRFVRLAFGSNDDIAGRWSNQWLLEIEMLVLSCTKNTFRRSGLSNWKYQFSFDH